MMKRTYYKTVTQIGIERKKMRLVYRALRLADPTLWNKLNKEAIDIIFLDNADVRSKINENGLDMVHKKSRELKRIKAEHIRERGICVDGILDNNKIKALK
jgi:hypothetical protein